MKTILITGATSGIGKAIAEKFAKNCWKLILVGRRKDRLSELQRSLDVPVYIVPRDIRDLDLVKQDLESLPSEFKDIDVLVNNAGLALSTDKVYEAKMHNWENMIDTNIKGLINYTRCILDIMMKRKCGHIMNISSIASRMPYAGGNVYCATKAFVGQFTRCMAADLMGTGIKSTSIEPWITETEFSRVRFAADDEDRAKHIYEGWKPVRPEDIAEAVYWAAVQPMHVNVSCIEISSTDQSYSGFSINRNVDI